MRRSLTPLSGLESLNHTPSSADFTITTSGFRFSIYTPRVLQRHDPDVVFALPIVDLCVLRSGRTAVPLIHSKVRDNATCRKLRLTLANVS